MKRLVVLAVVLAAALAGCSTGEDEAWSACFEFGLTVGVDDGFTPEKAAESAYAFCTQERAEDPDFATWWTDPDSVEQMYQQIDR